MYVLGDSFIPNFGPTVPFPSSPLSCLMGQVRKFVPLVKGSHPRSVGQFKAGVPISPASQERGAGSDEQTGQESQMALGFSGNNCCAATLFRARTAGGVRDFLSRFC